MRISTRLAVLLALILPLILPSGADAQSAATFAELRLYLNLGDTVTVDDVAGPRVRGRLLRMTPELIVLATGGAETTLTGDQVRRVGTCCDPLRNGTLIGLGAGAVFGAVSFLGFSDHPKTSDAAFGAAAFGALGAGLGLGLDALIRTDRVVYRAPVLTPRVSAARGRREVGVVWFW